MSEQEFKPYVADGAMVPEFTPKAILWGCIFGIIFGASNAFLALKAGLTVSASIPISVIAISLLKKLGGSTILENNMVQTIGSAGESIATGVVFTLTGFLFLSPGANGEQFFNYWVITTLAMLGGILGVLMMIPLRRALIVQEHGTLPYPEGTACASVLIAGEKGGNLAKTAYLGLAVGAVYAFLQLVMRVFAEAPTWVSNAKSKIFPAAQVDGAITAEYMGIGYILGVRYSALLVAGGVLSALVLVPLLASLVPADAIAMQLVKLGRIKDVAQPGAFGWDPATKSFGDLAGAIFQGYVKQIGAGMVAAGGFITLIKTIPTIINAFKGAVGSMKGGKGAVAVRRTENDLPLTVVIAGSIGLVAVIAILPFIPGTGIFSKILLGILMVIFGFFFVTVSSRIVGIIGSSSNPVSGMTIAAVMATCLIFLGLGWTGDVYQPMALCVGGIVCVAACNAGATSQDLKTGYLVGATPRAQQIGLVIGAVVSAAVVGYIIPVLDNPKMVDGTVVHQIGTTLAAPQGTLMATLIKGLLSYNLDWQFVLAGAFVAITMELCGVRALAFAVGAYLGMGTGLPIFIGGLVRWLADKKNKAEVEDDLAPGNLFATGLVAAGALMGVATAFARVFAPDMMKTLNMEHAIAGAFGEGGFYIMGVIAFALLGLILFRIGTRNGGKVDL